MAKSPYKCYWDACVFISMIEAHPARMPVINAILHEAEKGEVEIYTSTISITEVAFAKSEKDNQALDPSAEAKIDKLWLPSSPFKLCDIFDTITIEAKALIRQAVIHGRSLKPIDAIHIATAKHVEAKAIHTYDEKMTKQSVLTTFDIEEPRTDHFTWDDEA